MARQSQTEGFLMEVETPFGKQLLSPRDMKGVFFMGSQTCTDIICNMTTWAAKIGSWWSSLARRFKLAICDWNLSMSMEPWKKTNYISWSHHSSHIGVSTSIWTSPVSDCFAKPEANAPESKLWKAQEAVKAAVQIQDFQGICDLFVLDLPAEGSLGVILG